MIGTGHSKHKQVKAMPDGFRKKGITQSDYEGGGRSKAHRKMEDLDMIGK